MFIFKFIKLAKKQRSHIYIHKNKSEHLERKKKKSKQEKITNKETTNKKEELTMKI